MKPTPTNLAVLLIAGVFAAGVGVVGYQWARAAMAKDIYRDRLIEAEERYQSLATQYNQAITPRPVTELLVTDGKVCVVVRTGEGEPVTIPTPFDGFESEIFVDYAYIDGRLLIRRVFDENTAANSPQAVVIDPKLVGVKWDQPGAQHGKIIYRNRMTDGRWVITVTGDGSLGLKKVSDSAEVDLVDRPYIKEFEPVEQNATRDAEAIGLGDVWKYLVD